MNYFNYKKYTLEELYDALRNIDQEKYPDRMAELEKEIKIKESDPKLSKEALIKELGEDKRFWIKFWAGGIDQETNSSICPVGLEFIKIMYVLFGSSGIIILFFTIPVATGGNISTFLGYLFFTCIAWTIFYGINRIKSWVVPAILIYASFSFIAFFLSFYLIRVESVSGIFYKVIYAFFVFFNAFQIFVFSRSKTRTYFKETGKFLIS